MGLDVSHGCWHGAYSAFMTWRCKLAEIAGLPPLYLMEGFYKEGNPLTDPCWRSQFDKEGSSWYLWREMQRSLPIRWECLNPDILYELLYHSDCDGTLEVEILEPLAKRLEDLLPLLPTEPQRGHIGDWREKTQDFIDGLRLASERKEIVEFG